MQEVRVVGHGVDTLVLNVCYADKYFQPTKQELAEDLQNELNLLQGAARFNEAPVITHWAFKGSNLFMQEKGSRGQCRWILKSPLLTVAISRGRHSRIVAQVCLSSEYLWSCEYLAEAIVEMGMFLYSMFGDYLWFQVSEVDLCADVVGWDVSQANWQECFISRTVGDDGRPRDEDLLIDGPDVVRRHWKRIETLDFGKHTSPVSCCIYHKTAEIRRKSPTKVWFHDLWKRNGWDGECKVWRVEFRLIREFLLSLWEFQMKFTGKRSELCRESVGGENGSPPIHQAINFSEKLAPDKYYLVRVALRLMGVAASALDTGQFSLASFASFWKVSSSMPGTTASVSRSIGLMAKPPGT